MTPERLFSFCNLLALGGWLLLLVAGRRKYVAALCTSVFIPSLLAVIYLSLLIGHWGETPGGFRTLAGVASLFSNHWMLLAGWVHYLAFDLFVGSWEMRDSARHGIPYLLVIPCLLLTFLFGPVGLLLYLAIRGAKARTLLVE